METKNSSVKMANKKTDSAKESSVKGISCWERDYNVKKYRVSLLMDLLRDEKLPNIIVNWRFRSDEGFDPNRTKVIKSMIEEAYTQETHMKLTEEGTIEEDITVAFDVIIQFNRHGLAKTCLLPEEIRALVSYSKGPLSGFRFSLPRDPVKGSPFTDEVYRNEIEYNKRLKYSKEINGNNLFILVWGGDLEKEGPLKIGFRKYEDFEDSLYLFESGPDAKEKRRNLIRAGTGRLSLPFYKDALNFSLGETIEEEFLKAITKLKR